MVRTPPAHVRARFPRTASIASILKPPQSAHSTAPMPSAFSEIGDLVRFDGVMERADLEAELVRHLPSASSMSCTV